MATAGPPTSAHSTRSTSSSPAPSPTRAGSARVSSSAGRSASAARGDWPHATAARAAATSAGESAAHATAAPRPHPPPRAARRGRDKRGGAPAGERGGGRVERDLGANARRAAAWSTATSDVKPTTSSSRARVRARTVVVARARAPHRAVALVVAASLGARPGARDLMQQARLDVAAAAGGERMHVVEQQHDARLRARRLIVVAPRAPRARERARTRERVTRECAVCGGAVDASSAPARRR